MLAYEADPAILHVTDVNEEKFDVEIDTIYIRLFDSDGPDGSHLASLPPGILGFQNITFERSRLTVNNQTEEVLLELREPPTPFRF